MIDSPWFRCKACDKELQPHKVKVLCEDEEVIEVWENLCPECRAKVPNWNRNTEQWNNDSSSIRFTHSSMGDSLGELLHSLHNGGSSGGSFNSECRD
ncbi:hypothetical protein [Vibrio cholerae]|uniref:hypothetical protein n=1 Tax=Vibrio phage ICP2_2013_A_Haiti TaxID=1529058 RepID=UPI0004E5E95A|nr:hypothetical protein [Vibrio cholerae]YP_009056256.1 hypothetical protein LD36_gp44 [Vibrio phage ICP2_2013_A_Haiti]AII27158.1 hypothetical protein ICP22013AHaiti_44 [Vibrio phage ICP2_2013_A_Haiti]